jgi:multiple antibiotic resistance protein
MMLNPGELGQLIVLFFVIIDPITSFAVFFVLTHDKSQEERIRTAVLAVTVAAGLSYAVLFLGNLLLSFFSTTIDDFRIAGGIILLILGIQMALGQSYQAPGGSGANHKSVQAIAAIIATPFLSGPATITAVIISVKDFGILATGLAVTIVLVFTAVLFLLSAKLNRFINKTAVQIMSTVMGLLTIAWGVMYIRVGIMAFIGT